ncbi:hypothetical protein CC85DRAFT_285328 [Cutaneotrichosporon oleaginosum]|uniref:CUE domain-containing protein n=1 Tax=Cutaneotrichosporon oleaginosum TaxID=879819 RepID=A0A0J0XN93_9TREE|nr:uncharacterized protein CC85DRAFT_285328 [Cutaneotrichosporon oleaginosum]KLT42595.1 hypothetical protein CC85DRAFT_285328 [Cutaneotrichosporon oleaginosum]TXT05288.1 hypothetical protein COLE_06608 [Cutaneotrichosporon oleaginosum]
MASPTSSKEEPKSPKSPSPVDKVAAASPRATSPASPSADKPGSKPSSPAPGAAAATSPPPAAPAPAPAPHANPKIAELQTMFPTVDVSVIEMVLESVGGSQDRAIESLLQMTDPDFKPDELASAQQEESNQVDLDAEFARAIALQDEEEARQLRRDARGGRGPAAPSNASRLPEVLPYQPRVRKPRRPVADPYESENARAQELQDRYDPPPGQGQNQGELPPGLIAFEEKVTAMAETGRQTFNRFFNNAKAKYAEYQAQQAQTSEQRAAHQALNDEVPRQGGLWGESTGRTSLGSRSTSQSSQGEAPISAPARRWHPSDNYEEPGRPSTTSAIPGAAGRRSPGPAGAASPDKGAAGKIDLAKLGFLPKKRVDLMSTSPQPREDKDPNPHIPTSTGPTTPTTGKSLVDKIPKTPPAETSPHTLGDSDDDDDLDYTENPFDRR